MAAVDELKKLRSQNYGESGDAKPEIGDPDEPNSTSRIIKLSDDEQKAFQGAKPGMELACEVRGNLESDGHFHVMSLAPLNSEKDPTEEDGMAQQVAQLVRPQLQPSPS